MTLLDLVWTSFGAFVLASILLASLLTNVLNLLANSALDEVALC